MKEKKMKENDTRIKNIKICPAAPSHIEGIHAIEALCFPDPWSPQAIGEEIEREHSIYLVALGQNGLEQEKILGHASMRHIINEGHISNIAVAPQYQGQGIGAMLLQALIAQGIQKQMIGLTLEVRASNHSAIALYKKYGFVSEGHRKNYYQHPTEDAVIMWKQNL